MATYTCSKCGTHASSKCVNHRSTIYSDDDMWMAGALKMRYGVERLHPNGEDKLGELRITVRGVENGESIATVLHQLANMVTHFDVAKLFCDHDFVIDEGEECLFGCCARPTTEDAS